MLYKRRKFLKGFALSVGGIFVPRIILAPPGLSFFGKNKAASVGLLTGLVGYWKLDEASGNPRADSTGNGWTATEYIRAVPNIAGVIGNAQHDPFTLPMGLAVSASIDTRGATTPFSYQAWVHYQGGRSGNTCFGEWGGGTNDWRMQFGSTNTVIFDSDNASAVADSLQSTGTISLNAWHHIIFTWDGTTKKIYIDGSQDASTSTPSGIRRGDRRLITDNDESNVQQPNCDFDEAGYWNRALSAADVTSLYNGGAGKAFGTFTL